MRQKETDITVIRDMRKDVQLIQSAILKKKYVNLVADYVRELGKKGPISHEAEEAKKKKENEYLDNMDLHALSMLLIEKAGECLETLEQKRN